jgi:hypothetical protein
MHGQLLDSATQPCAQLVSRPAMCLHVQGRVVTCASNIVSDVNAGAKVKYDPQAGSGLAETHVDKPRDKATLVTGMHAGVLRSFLTEFIRQLPTPDQVHHNGAGQSAAE